ncbi:MAG: J domain-containing protein [Verrucomicrobiae bacterium]|nr:J domain-containing protein [Verrucomicrobiae bacterium]
MPVEFKDYYAVLGVPRGASDEEIKRAFRRLAREFHPDVAKDKRGAEDRFKEINEAYEVLGQPENRRKYDRLGANWKAGSEFRPPPGWGARRGRGRQGHGRMDQEAGGEFHFGGTGFSDFFEALFGGRARGGGVFEGFEESVGEGRGRGRDLESDMMVALDEVLHGSVRTITQQRGNGREGRSEATRFQVRIPPGVREGQRIRVAGKGEHRPGSLPGDLYLRVRLAKHPDFRVREGGEGDLTVDLPVAPWEAVLGATVPVQTLEGPVSLRVPPGSKAGQQLRLRGRGLPRGDGGTRGDLYVVIGIEMPGEVGEEERHLWEQLAARSRFQARSGR